MFGTVILCIVLMWTSFGAFDKMKKVAPMSSVDRCDLHTWYIDRVTEGAFSGQLTYEQEGIKARIERLIANTRGTPEAGLISCSTLTTFENILSPPVSQPGGQGGKKETSPSDSQLDDRRDVSLGTSKQTRPSDDQDSSRKKQDSERKTNKPFTGSIKDKQDATTSKHKQDSANKRSTKDSVRKIQGVDKNKGQENAPGETADSPDKRTSDRSKKPDEDSADMCKENESPETQHADTDLKNTDIQSDVDTDKTFAAHDRDKEKNPDIVLYELNIDDNEKDMNKDEIVVSDKDEANAVNRYTRYDITNKQKESDGGNGKKEDSRQGQNAPTVRRQTSYEIRTFTPSQECQNQRRTSRWSDYLFQPFIPPLTHSLTSTLFNLLHRCRNPVCSNRKKSKERTLLSHISCYYFHLLGYRQRMRNKTKPETTLAHIIKESCRHARKCSWICLYGVQKQQCVEHYDLHFNKSQTLSTVDVGSQDGGHGTDDTIIKRDEVENDDTELKDIDKKEEDTKILHEETPTGWSVESDDTDDNPRDDEGEAMAKKSRAGILDETEIEGMFTGEKQAKKSNKEEAVAGEKVKGNSRVASDFNPEREYTFRKTHDSGETEKGKKIQREPHENRGNTKSDCESSSISEAEMLRIEAMLHNKALEQATKIQSLEILVMRLENHILSQRLNEQNGTSHLVHLENQILRIENELLKLNQSYTALQAENEMLKSRQNKYLALEHKSQESKQISLPSNTTEYFQMVMVQQEKITHLSELLNNQSSVLHKLQSRSDQLEEQNQMLYQIVLNQTALISHVMHKLQEVSEQNLKNQQDTNQLKSMMDLNSASSNIINKLEHMLSVDSNNIGKPSGKTAPQQSSDHTDSKSSSHEVKTLSHVLTFLPKTSEYSPRTQQWRCVEGKSPRLCIYFSVIISPCTPFRTLYWGRCLHMIAMIDPTEETVQLGTTDGKDSLNKKQFFGKSSETTATDAENTNTKKADISAHSDEASHLQKDESSQSRDSAAQRKGVPDLVEIPNVKSVSGDSTVRSETPDQDKTSTSHKPQAQMFPLPVEAADGTEPEKTPGEHEDEDKTPESNKQGPESRDKNHDRKSEPAKQLEEEATKAERPGRKREKQDAEGKERGADMKREETNSGLSHRKGTSAETHPDAADKLEKNEKPSAGPSNPAQSEDLQKKKSDVVKMEVRTTSSTKDGSVEQRAAEEERKRKEEAEKAMKLKQEAEAMEKRIRDADIRRLLYWTADNKKPKDCYELYQRAPQGQARNGAYKVFVKGLNLYVTIYCDMKAGGWTVLMKREDGSLDFYRDWAEYKNGFGTPFGEHYLGNEVMHYLSNQGHYSLQVDLKDWKGQVRTASYRHFWLDSEEHYFRLHVLGYNGTAGDSLSKHDGMPFSTKDRDNDLLAKDQMGGSCARRFQGAGWYYKCYMSNLLGVHYENGMVPEKRFDGIAWKTWTGPSYSLKEVVLKIRPVQAG